MTDRPDCIFRIRTVLKRTGLSRSSLYRKMQSGAFPPSVRISIRCVGWRESAIDAWMQNPIFYEEPHR
ncbi:AlpA family phage regulatory protein [Sphingomonas sp. AP4-R1]|uniref:helix-turn-helix transcriptional regulator n=1 Tax=Sphingomonas sp. AP4-R1 TaxID=2735134 RepID=UPI001493D42B|nr:AlpA family phage regulatory protein [Sphingomonas sp. AP4-R1]QJU57389.1 AlpA family phage regulatory protein [Sphingomonas sp. AP4-R1]